MIINNINIYREDHTFLKGSILIKDGNIEKIYSAKEKKPIIDECVIDGKGCYAIPGMIDLHFHGCKGYDICDGTIEAIEKIAKYQASIGVTAIAPATMTLPVKELELILTTAANYVKNPCKNGADLVGINMEGPFISKTKKGAQDDKNIIQCQVDVYRHFQSAANGLVKFIGIAPEEGDSISFIKEVKDEVNVSLAHTNADYDTAKKAFDAGANHAVHLYNAMPPLHHRFPGVVGAVVDSSHVMSEIICDGIHVHPSVVRGTFKMMGEDRMIFISDSMRATGMKDGCYTLGGLDVLVNGNRATLVSNGALAGSVTNLPDCMRMAVHNMGIPLKTAIACVTENPAKSLGIFDQYGSISVGKKGNVVLLNNKLELYKVIKDGEEI